MKKKLLTGKYVLPTVERLDISVERGFASSIAGEGTIPDLEFDTVSNNFVEF